MCLLDSRTVARILCEHSFMSLPVSAEYLGRLETRSRTRFTFARELAHVMLREPEVMHLMARNGKRWLARDAEKS